MSRSHHVVVENPRIKKILIENKMRIVFERVDRSLLVIFSSTPLSVDLYDFNIFLLLSQLPDTAEATARSARGEEEHSSPWFTIGEWKIPRDYPEVARKPP